MANLFSMEAEVEGLDQLLEELEQKVSHSRDKDQGVFTTGFSAGYAAAVHDDMTKFYKEGISKFLETAVHEQRDAMRGDIRNDVKGGLGIRIASQNAAESIMKRAQELAPKDTGVLAASAFVKDENNRVVAGNDMTAEEALALRKTILAQRKGRP